MTRPIKGLTGTVATGDSTHFGTNDLDQVNALFTGVDQSADAIDMNTTWKYRSQKLVLRDPTNAFSSTVVNPTVTANQSFQYNEPLYDYYVFIDTDDSNKVKAKNWRTNCIDYVDSSYIDPVLNSIIGTVGSGFGITIRLSPQMFTANNYVTIPQSANGTASRVLIHGTNSAGRTTKGTIIITSVGGATNLNTHSFIESLSGTPGTNLSPSLEVGYITFANQNFATGTYDMGGIAIESDAFPPIGGLYFHDLVFQYCASAKGAIYMKGKGTWIVDNVYSYDSSATYKGTTDFCFVGGTTDATGGLLANDHSDGNIHSWFSRLKSSHTGTGTPNGSMQHTLWLGAKYSKLGFCNFDGWGFRDDPIVVKDSIGCVINDISHQDINVVDSTNVGDCGLLLYSSDSGGVSTCWGNRLYNMRFTGFPSVNRTNIKCDGLTGIGPQFNLIELEEYGANRIRLNELHGANNVFVLKPGSHNSSSFAQTTAQIDNLQTTSDIIDMRGGATGRGLSATVSGDGTTKVFNIAHGCYATPSFVNVTPALPGAIGSYSLSATSTNVVITYPIAPPSGTNNLQWYWEARVY